MSGKSVSLSGGKVAPDTCTGHVEHQRTIHSSNGYLDVGFWSTQDGSKTCVGDIFINTKGPVSYVTGSVKGKDGDYYCFLNGNPNLEWTCGTEFYRPFSVIARGYIGTSLEISDRVKIG